MKEYTKRVILLVVICVVTISVLVVVLKIHDRQEKDKLSTSRIDNYLTEIKYEEISTHVVEQPSIIIYVSNSSDDATKKFDELFIPIVKKYNLENEIIYININETIIVDPIYQNSPELIFYHDGEISDIIDCTTLKSNKDIIKELKERSVISD